MRTPIFVEIEIRAPLDVVWHRTQEPALHQRWDLRFSEISYLPKASEDQVQQFRYATRIGFGLVIEGGGETVGTRDLIDGSRTSALRFWSDSGLSLIHEGSGYWKYVQLPSGVRFFTSYDYRVRWGGVGRIIDRIFFRPLIGWATAWSFDRLGRWIEDGIDPTTAARLWITHGIARIALIVVFCYHGIVPKLVLHDRDELVPLLAAGMTTDAARMLVTLTGIAEILLAVALLATWRHRTIPFLVIGVMLAAIVLIAITAPQFIGSAFNVVSLNLSVVALAIIDILTSHDLVTATRCARAQRRAVV
jgi:hypothetical protein